MQYNNGSFDTIRFHFITAILKYFENLYLILTFFVYWRKTRSFFYISVIIFLTHIFVVQTSLWILKTPTLSTNWPLWSTKHSKAMKEFKAQNVCCFFLWQQLFKINILLHIMLENKNKKSIIAPANLWPTWNGIHRPLNIRTLRDLHQRPTETGYQD